MKLNKHKGKGYGKLNYGFLNTIIVELDNQITYQIITEIEYYTFWKIYWKIKDSIILNKRELYETE